MKLPQFLCLLIKIKTQGWFLRLTTVLGMCHRDEHYYARSDERYYAQDWNGDVHSQNEQTTANHLGSFNSPDHCGYVRNQYCHNTPTILSRQSTLLMCYMCSQNTLHWILNYYLSIHPSILVKHQTLKHYCVSYQPTLVCQKNTLKNILNSSYIFSNILFSKQASNCLFI